MNFRPGGRSARDPVCCLVARFGAHVLALNGRLLSKDLRKRRLCTGQECGVLALVLQPCVLLQFKRHDCALPLLRQGMLHLRVLRNLRMLRHSVSRTVHPIRSSTQGADLLRRRLRRFLWRRWAGSLKRSRGQRLRTQRHTPAYHTESRGACSDKGSTSLQSPATRNSSAMQRSPAFFQRENKKIHSVSLNTCIHAPPVVHRTLLPSHRTPLEHPGSTALPTLALAAASAHSPPRDAAFTPPFTRLCIVC